jgi:hypothetical protein
MHMLRSARLLIGLGSIAAACTASFAADVWMQLYDGKDFNGWQGKTGTIWKIDTAGVIVANNTGLPAMNGQNTFLFTDSLNMFSDFHLKLDARMPGTGGYRNSGIMYRSTIKDKNAFSAAGYQYEFSDGGTGAFYHEQGNELGFTGGCADAPNGKSDWKKVEIIADGPHVTHYLAGKSCFDYKTFKVTTKGYIALQLHAPGDFTMNFRNIRIQPVNGSFSIPAEKAVDSLGNKISIVGINIVPKRNSANLALGLPGALIGYDAQGRAIPAKSLRADRPTLLLFDRETAVKGK